MIRKILLAVLVVIIIAQFIQPPYNEGSTEGPGDIAHTLSVPANVQSILSTSCYDCHSDNTNYPWYNRITPVNWWLKGHIDDGKKELNFTQFRKYSAKRMNKKLEEIIETIKSHEMPLESYLWIHKEAKLSDAQRVQLTDWASQAQQQLAQDSAGKF